MGDMHIYRFLSSTCIEKLKRIGLQVAVTCFYLLIPLSAWSGSAPDKELIPIGLNPVFEQLMALNHPDGSQTIDSASLDALVDFVMAPKAEGKLYHTDDLFEMSSAFYEFIFKKNIAHILKLAYNPELPSFLTNPSSVRLSYWTRHDKGRENHPKLWEMLGENQTPVIVKGHEIVENTPDLNTGGYYRYGLDRTLILMKHRGNNLLISLSKQSDISEVGKKGLVLGSDDDWNYLYSGKKGLNKSGLGWVKSHMYDSFSAIIYYEMPGETPQVKCGAFKWLNAGWRKFNMVKEHHIHRGLLRYEQAFKGVVEEPTLPDVSEIVKTYAKIKTMKMDALQQLNLAYLKAIRDQYADDKALSSKWVADTVSDRQVEKMDQHELRAVIMLDYIKSLLGKPHYIDMTKLGTS